MNLKDVFKKKKEVVVAYKGFNKDLTCLGFQYEIGKTYRMDGEIGMCKRGVHACESPLDTFAHYPIDKSRYCIVELSGKIIRDSEYHKTCASEIRIVRELTVNDMIKRGKHEIDHAPIGRHIPASDTFCKVSNERFSQVVFGNFDAFCLLKDASVAILEGIRNSIALCGVFSTAVIRGNGNVVSCVGAHACVLSTGDNAVISCLGNASRARAKKGSWITLAEYKENAFEGYPPSDAPILCVKTEYVDGERIKEDVWYTIKDGEFVEAKTNTGN